MTETKKGEIISQGKTKTIFATSDDPTLVIVQNRDEITKNDDATLTEEMASKAEYATTTTCQVFQLLKEAGLPVAFEKQISSTEFLAPRCIMIPLEVIIRRYAVGSYLKRLPHLRKPEGEPPSRFHKLVFELFLKTTDGQVKDKSGEIIGEVPNDILISDGSDKPVDDPFIANPFDEIWKLKHPKIPAWNNDSDLDLEVPGDQILPDGISVGQIEKITRQVFLALESAWSQLSCRLIDFKIEFGLDTDGNLLVADVIDNDSWRLRTADWEELSKQLFRDNYAMERISEKYALVAELVKSFTLPEQVIVFWRGSDKDTLPECESIPGVEVLDVVKSGHKSTQICLEKLEEILATFPQGGVIIPVVGLSNWFGTNFISQNQLAGNCCSCW